MEKFDINKKFDLRGGVTRQCRLRGKVLRVNRTTNIYAAPVQEEGILVVMFFDGETGKHIEWGGSPCDMDKCIFDLVNVDDDHQTGAEEVVDKAVDDMIDTMFGMNKQNIPENHTVAAPQAPQAQDQRIAALEKQMSVLEGRLSLVKTGVVLIMKTIENMTRPE